MTEVNIKNLSLWCKIDFQNYSANPLLRGAKLILNDKESNQLVIPEDILIIKDYAFYNCESINSVTIHDNVTSINYQAFYGCNSLTKVTIGDSVTSIDDRAFGFCTSLTEVTIGDSVTSIGNYAFESCPIEVCYCYATVPPEISSIDTISGATLYVPARCGATYKQSVWGRNFKNIIEMD